MPPNQRAVCCCGMCSESVQGDPPELSDSRRTRSPAPERARRDDEATHTPASAATCHRVRGRARTARTVRSGPSPTWDVDELSALRNETCGVLFDSLFFDHAVRVPRTESGARFFTAIKRTGGDRTDGDPSGRTAAAWGEYRRDPVSGSCKSRASSGLRSGNGSARYPVRRLVGSTSACPGRSISS